MMDSLKDNDQCSTESILGPQSESGSMSKNKGGLLPSAESSLLSTGSKRSSDCQVDEISSKKRSSDAPEGGNQEEFLHVIVDEVSVLSSSISELKASVAGAGRSPSLAIDCEGVKLSRDGKLTLLTVATPTKVFLYDVLKLGQSVFENGLKEILEDASVEKLMFDCRNDSDALYHLYNVNLAGVLDVQLLEVVSRKEQPAPFVRHNQRLRHLTSQPAKGAEILKGYLKCLDLYVNDPSVTDMKRKGSNLLNLSSGLWEKRPLTEDMINYACVDAIAMFKMFASFKAKPFFEKNLNRVRGASKLYADYQREVDKRAHDNYESNRYLPLTILLFLEFGEMRASGTKKCDGCKRWFDSQFVFKKNPLCIVCNRVMQEMNNREHREHLFDDVEEYGYDSPNEDNLYCW